MNTCTGCLHDGCCDGLPYCGGKHFTPRWVPCHGEDCTNTVDRENEAAYCDEDGNYFCDDCWSKMTNGEGW